MNNTSTDAQGIDCSVVIVTWNSEEFISDCINSLYKYGKSWISKIVVVDNHSTDRTVEILESQFPDVIVIKNRANLGFGRANNIGLAECDSEYVMLLNPDTKFIDKTPLNLVSFLSLHRDVAMIGPRIVTSSGQGNPYRGFPEFLTVFLHELGTDKVYYGDIGESTSEVDWLTAACVCLRKDAIQQAKGFDTDYFLYYEDMDLCWRFYKLGWRMMYFPASSICHYVGGSEKLWQKSTFLHIKKGLVLFTGKHYGICRALSVRFALFLGLSIKLVCYLVISPFSKESRRRLPGYAEALSFVFVSMKGR